MKKENVQVVLVLAYDDKKRSSAISQAGVEHLGLGCLKTALTNANISTEIINFEVLNYLRSIQKITYKSDNQYLLEKIKEGLPLLVGFSTTTLSFLSCLKLAKAVKNFMPSIKIVFGGPHASVCYNEILDNYSDTVDYIIIGDGEKPILDLYSHISKGYPALTCIPNLAYRKDNTNTKSNISFRTYDLDYDIKPSRDDLLLMQKYIDCQDARIFTSWDCTGNCVFCCESALNPTRTWIGRNAKDIVDEIECLYNLGVRRFWINDDNFIPPTHEGRHRAKLIAEEILARKLKISYRGLIRADAFEANDDLLPLLKESGFNTAFVGFETGSATKLKRYNKHIDLEQYYILYEELEKNNIALQIGFLVFDPFCTVSEFKEDILFLRNISQACIFTNVIQRIDVFPGTPIHRQLKKHRYLISTEVNEYECLEYSFLDSSVEKIYNVLSSIYNDEVIALDRQVVALKIGMYSKSYDKTECEHVLNLINENNYSFFNDVVSSISKNFDESILISQYKKIYQQHVALLQSLPHLNEVSYGKGNSK